MRQSSAINFRRCFRSLFHSGQRFVFPCDDQGKVDLDRLSERTRNDYFFARAMVGRELIPPAVEAVDSGF